MWLFVRPIPNTTQIQPLPLDTTTSLPHDGQPIPEVPLSPPLLPQAGIPLTPLPTHCFSGRSHNTGLGATQGEHTQNPALLAQAILQGDPCSWELEDLLCPPLPVLWGKAGARGDLFPAQMATETYSHGSDVGLSCVGASQPLNSSLAAALSYEEASPP